MNAPIYHETKKEFQLERMIFFSDAVFAIAITLLVIDIKIPEITRPITDEKLLDGLAIIFPKLIGFIVSFFVIGLYWTIHHSIFGYVINYTTQLLWINLLFLFGVVLMPFSTSFFSEYLIEFRKTPVIIYSINISFLGVMNFFLWKYITNPRRRLTGNLSAHFRAYRSFRALVVPATFMIMLAWYLFSPKFAIFIPPLIPLIMYIAGRYYKKKFPEDVVKVKISEQKN